MCHGARRTGGPAGADDGFWAELRSLLHASGSLGLAHDSGFEEWDIDPCYPSDARINRPDRYPLSQAQSGQRDRARR